MARKKLTDATPAPTAEPVLLNPEESEAPESLLDAASSEEPETLSEAPVDDSQETAADDATGDADEPLTPRQAKLAELEAEHASLLEEFTAIQRQRFELQQREAEIGRKMDRLTRAMTPLQKQESEADAIQAYIKRQNEVRLEKAQRVQSLLQVGVDPSEIRRPMSQIDAALARNRKRGGNRPEYPKVG